MSNPTCMDSRIPPREDSQPGCGRLYGMADFIGNVLSHNFGQIQVPAAPSGQYPQHPHEKNPFSERHHSQLYYKGNPRKDKRKENKPRARRGERNVVVILAFMFLALRKKGGDLGGAFRLSGALSIFFVLDNHNLLKIHGLPNIDGKFCLTIYFLHGFRQNPFGTRPCFGPESMN